MGWDDNRGVSEVLGAMLLFGIVIVALGSYQTFVVPQQNAEIELQHDAQVNDDFAGIQSAISNAAATGTTRTTSVTLGTQYPVRAAGLNPPTVSGQLATGTDGEISANGIDGHSLDTICGLSAETQAITYRANYNEFDDAGTLAYENGVTYRDAGDNILVRNEQELVDNSTIRLFPLVDEGLATSSSSSEQLRFAPGETGTQTVDTEGDNLTLTFPSRLDNKTWKTEVLAGADNVTGVSESDGEITVVFEPGSYTVHCTPLGIGETPEQGSVPDEETDPKEAADSINPASDGEVVLNETSAANGTDVTLTFSNKTNAGSEVLIVGARLNYYYTGGPGESGGSKPETVEIGGTTLAVGGVFEKLSDPVALNPSYTDVELSFSSNVGADNFYVLTLEFSHGTVSTYFVSH